MCYFFLYKLTRKLTLLESSSPSSKLRFASISHGAGVAFARFHAARPRSYVTYQKASKKTQKKKLNYQVPPPSTAIGIMYSLADFLIGSPVDALSESESCVDCLERLFDLYYAGKSTVKQQKSHFLPLGNVGFLRLERPSHWRFSGR